MRLVFLGINYSPEQIGVAVYSTGLCEALAEAGHVISVVAGKPYYPDWSIFKSYRGGFAKRAHENRVHVTRITHYVPAKPTGGKRMLHHLSFAVAAAPILIHRVLRLRPHVVMAVAPSLISAPVAWAAARFTGTSCWLHIQDLEVDAAFATGLLPRRGVVSAIARSFQRFIMRRFDVVSSISPEMCGKLVSIGVEPKRIVELRNWADLDSVHPLARLSKYRSKWGITTPHVALYSGNIAAKQDIEIILEAARILSYRSDLTFVICGNGPRRALIEEKASNLCNIQFHGLQPVADLGELLGLASVHLLPQSGGAADLVLPSKLTNMLASGKPVVATAATGTGLARELKGCGLVTPPDEGTAFAAAIEELLDNPTRRKILGARARARAEEVWQKQSILGGFQERLSALARRPRKER